MFGRIDVAKPGKISSFTGISDASFHDNEPNKIIVTSFDNYSGCEKRL